MQNYEFRNPGAGETWAGLPRLLLIPCLLASALARGACTVSAEGVAFGNYDVFNPSSTDSTGNIAVTCDSAASYTLSLGPGLGSLSDRYMGGAVDRLYYNLYTDASRSLIWGDGSAGTAVVSGESSGGTGNHTIYGRIFAQQNVRADSYSDLITVTIEF